MQYDSKPVLLGISEAGDRINFGTCIPYVDEEFRYCIQSPVRWKTEIPSSVALMIKLLTEDWQIFYCLLVSKNLEIIIYPGLNNCGYLYKFKRVFQPSKKLYSLVDWEINLFKDPTCIDAYHDWLIDNELYNAAKGLIPSQYSHA